MADSAASAVSPDLAPEATEPTSSRQTVDPYNVQGEVAADGTVKAIDYWKLVDEFGTQLITDELLQRFERVTGHRPHHFMRRGIVFSHRDLELILDRYEKGEPFFLYTGRGPSSDSMHLGHVIPFEFTKWLQDVFDVPLVIEMTDDEKYLVSEKRTVDEVRGYCWNNAKDIIAIGFDPRKTFIFSDFDYVGGAFYRNIVRVAKHITLNQARGIFGFNDSANVGRIFFGSIQSATSFASSFPQIFGEDEGKTSKIPSLIPCAIDQDPYFRMTRDVAARLHFAKPCCIHARFLDALQGPGSKMSASIDTSAIFMKDSVNTIKRKINKYAFSGGQMTVEEHREKGGDTTKDVPYQYLTFFLDDDAELEQIRADYTTGRLLTGEIKAKCIAELQKYVVAFQARRAAVTDDTVRRFMKPRALEWRGNPRAPAPLVVPVAEEGAAAAAAGGGEGEEGEGKMTKNQLKKLEKQRQIEEKKSQKAKAKEAAAGDAPS